jgi:hypothetical protein
MTAISNFKAMLAATASAVGMARTAALAAPEQRAKEVHTRNGLRGKIRRGFGNPHRKRPIKVERLGPYYRQVGWTAEGKRLMQTHFIVKRLHATKGWRVNTVPIRTVEVAA